MKKFILIFLSLIFATGAYAAVTNSYQANAVLKKLFSISQTTALNFGTIYVSPTTAGTVTLLPTNAISTTGSHNLAGGQTAGVFSVTGGDASSTILVSVTNATLTNGTDSLTTALSPDAATLALSASGTGTIKVAGTLSVPAATSSGTYTGTFNININYQ